MKESNNTDMNGKVQYPPSGVGGYGGPFVLYSNNPQQVAARADYYVPTQDQQLPIIEKEPYSQANIFTEWYSGYEPAGPFQNNMPVPAWRQCMNDERRLGSLMF